jgi:N-acetylneuraminate synthase
MDSHIESNYPLFTAELSINHLGMVEIAKRMIEAAKESGADVVKLKMKDVRDYYTDESKEWRNFNFIEYRESLELSKSDFREINEFCNDLNIEWFATVHDSESREFIRQFDPPFYKIASMDSGKDEFVDETIEVCRKENKPLVISMGGKDYEEEKEIIKKVERAGVKAFVLHCVSMYPTQFGESNIPHILEMIEEFESDLIKIGYSGHEQGIAPSILAAEYGAKMIERHLALTRDFKIHHIDAAITPGEFANMTTIISRMGKEQNTNIDAMHKEELEFLENRNYGGK